MQQAKGAVHAAGEALKGTAATGPYKGGGSARAGSPAAGSGAAKPSGRSGRGSGTGIQSADESYHDEELSFIEPVYATRTAIHPAPQRELLQKTMPAYMAKNLSTFVNTWVEPEAEELMMRALPYNMADAVQYPSAAEMEKRCVSFLAHLWHCPDDNFVGTGCVGSSEACYLGGIAMKKRWQAARRAAGLPTDKPNLVVSHVAQVCWQKFCVYWDVEPRYVDVTEDCLVLDPEKMRDHIDENTIGVVCMMGSTYNGQFEPVERVDAVLEEIFQEHGWDIPLHVDAANAGLVAPLCKPEVVFDFRLKHVVSINVSGHKYGGTFCGCAFQVWRSRDWLPKDMVLTVDYLGKEESNLTVNFSRPGAQIVGQYYNFIRLGKDGFKREFDSLYRIYDHLKARLEATGHFQILSTADMPVLAWRLKPGQKRECICGGSPGTSKVGERMSIPFENATRQQQSKGINWAHEIKQDHELPVTPCCVKVSQWKGNCSFELSECPAADQTGCKARPTAAYNNMKKMWEKSGQTVLFCCPDPYCHKVLNLGKVRAGQPRGDDFWAAQKRQLAEELGLDNNLLRILELDEKAASQLRSCHAALASLLSKAEVEQVELVSVGHEPSGNGSWYYADFRLPTCGVKGCARQPLITGQQLAACKRLGRVPCCPTHKFQTVTIDSKTFTCQSCPEVASLEYWYDEHIDHSELTVDSLHDSLRIKLSFVEAQKFDYLPVGVNGIPDGYATLGKAWKADDVLFGHSYKDLCFLSRKCKRIELAGGPGKVAIIMDSKVPATVAYKPFYCEGVKAVTGWGHTFETHLYDNDFYTGEDRTPHVLYSADEIVEWRDKYLELRDQNGHLTVRVPYFADEDGAPMWRVRKAKVGNPLSFGNVAAAAASGGQTHIEDYFSPLNMFKDDQASGGPAEDLDAEEEAPAPTTNPAADKAAAAKPRRHTAARRAAAQDEAQDEEEDALRAARRSRNRSSRKQHFEEDVSEDEEEEAISEEDSEEEEEQEAAALPLPRRKAS
ncbi:Glutamate decarboxylase [Chlorella sorokiniana]|uniref:Glutamate decarboxylase n=1 Tax=Chlorella sorokiniana TaxID=3076 RepID=A0A2P6U2Q9_CHLSO|nr:Glutamate decarboxylase [Chlorella sorokiniana]|eukprot:PRW60590.1 Glutamate decarboxylase [Chlorella sorokiniana]